MALTLVQNPRERDLIEGKVQQEEGGEYRNKEVVGDMIVIEVCLFLTSLGAADRKNTTKVHPRLYLGIDILIIHLLLLLMIDWIKLGKYNK